MNKATLYVSVCDYREIAAPTTSCKCFGGINRRPVNIRIILYLNVKNGERAL